jgi:tetratricopeptide (TPR) repeat protein
MTSASLTRRPTTRTLLEAKIRERSMTLEEFAEHAEAIARAHPDIGTLSLRHLQRLIAGTSDPDRVRPATKRLLEHIFAIPANDLLRSITPPDDEWRQNSAELDWLIATAKRVDPAAIRLFAEQIDIIRKLDRRFGAAALLGALRQHAQHIEGLMSHSMGATQKALAAVLTDAHTLAGWQSLDRGDPVAAWQHYHDACASARTAESPALLAHAFAEQAVVLADLGRTAEAAQLSGHARSLAAPGEPLLRSWLAAAHGEALAADRQLDAALRAFDAAHDLLPDTPGRLDDGPYLALDPVHLARWRGHALAQHGHPDATTVLRDALNNHDAEFTRAEAGLRVDLVVAHARVGELAAARNELAAARRTADAVGSARQRRRLDRVAATIA